MSDFCESERKRMNWLNSFQLPNQYKKIGWYFVLFVFILMIAKKLIDEPNWIKPVLKNAMILGFLIISLSKEKIEDELITKLRAQSYRLAFVFAVVYSLVQPYIEYGVDYLFNTNEVSMGFSYYQVLIFMLVVQIGFFEQFKRSA